MSVPIGAVLFGVLVAAICVLWYAKRRGMRLRVPGSGDRLKVVERLAISQGATLVLVEYEGRRLLLGVTAAHLSLIEDRPAQPIPQV